MTVEQLIDTLSRMPSHASVELFYDSALRLSADKVWLARKGTVGIAEANGGFISGEDLPNHVSGENEGCFRTYDLL